MLISSKRTSAVSDNVADRHATLINEKSIFRTNDARDCVRDARESVASPSIRIYAILVILSRVQL